MTMTDASTRSGPQADHHLHAQRNCEQPLVAVALRAGRTRVLDRLIELLQVVITDIAAAGPQAWPQSIAYGASAALDAPMTRPRETLTMAGFALDGVRTSGGRGPASLLPHQITPPALRRSAAVAGENLPSLM